MNQTKTNSTKPRSKQLWWWFGIIFVLVLIVQLIIIMLEPPPPETLNVISVSPVGGIRSTLDNFEAIRVEFSDPIDPESVELSVSPDLPARFVVLPENSSALLIIPEGNGWRPHVRYVVTLELASDDGKVLAEPFVYGYQNIPPDVTQEILPY